MVGMENSDVTESPRAEFMGACLDYLEGESEQIPDPSHLSPEDAAFIKWWLTSLSRTRDTIDMLAAMSDRASAKDR